MKFGQRKEKIIQLLDQKKFVPFSELSEQINASDATIRRDLCALEKEGKLLRFHGGIKQVDSVVEASMNYKKKISKSEKEEISQYVSTLLGNEGIVFLGAGSTTYNLIKYLNNSDATFVTNGLGHAESLNNNDMRVFMVCGFLKEHTKSLIGEKTNEMLSTFTFDKVIISANGISDDFELVSADEYEHNIKKTVIARAKKVIVLADNKKFHKTGMYRLPIDRKNSVIVTDKKSDVKSEKYKIIKCK